MSRTQFILALLFALLAVVPVEAGPGGLFARKPKADAAKTRSLIETLKSDPDEKKRKSAADELSGVEASVGPEAGRALVAALKNDTSASVRVVAADSLRQLGEVYPQAGTALEAAAEGDSSPLVRLAAKRALWEYHLNGYRSAKGADGHEKQSMEPPLARPSNSRPTTTMIPAPPIMPPTPAALAGTPILPSVATQAAPKQVVQFGPRMFWPTVMPGQGAAIRAAVNATPEPPIAKGTPSVIPPIPQYKIEQTITLPIPEFVPTLPPFKPDLPSVVSPPDAKPAPSSAPVSVPTAMPPSSVPTFVPKLTTPPSGSASRK